MDLWDLIDAGLIAFVSTRVIKSLLEWDRFESRRGETRVRPCSRAIPLDDHDSDHPDSDVDSDW